MTQADLIFKELMQGKKLTVRDMFTSPVFSNSPCRRISDLKELGVPIKDAWTQTKNNKPIKFYYLEKKDMKKFNKRAGLQVPSDWDDTITSIDIKAIVS
jgi:hypothetical protein